MRHKGFVQEGSYGLIIGMTKGMAIPLLEKDLWKACKRTFILSYERENL